MRNQPIGCAIETRAHYYAPAIATFLSHPHNDGSIHIGKLLFRCRSLLSYPDRSNSLPLVRRCRMPKDRLEAFSDGVIAIIITIMVLELRVPHGTDLAVLRPLVPVLLSYVLSFVFVGIYWNNHHR